MFHYHTTMTCIAHGRGVVTGWPHKTSISCVQRQQHPHVLNLLVLAPPGPLRSLGCREEEWGLWSCDSRDWLSHVTIGSFPLAADNCIYTNLCTYAAAQRQGPPAMRPHVFMRPVPRDLFLNTSTALSDCITHFRRAVNWSSTVWFYCPRPHMWTSPYRTVIIYLLVLCLIRWIIYSDLPIHLL